MKKIWKNPLLYAVCAVIPLSSAMSLTLPNHFANTTMIEAKEELPTAINRINKHITSVREEILFHDNTDCIIVYDQFLKEIKRAYVDNKLQEGDVHQIIEAISFASSYHMNEQEEKSPKILQPIQRAQDLLQKGSYDKDLIIAALVKDTVVHSGARIEDINSSFGSVVAEEIQK